LNKVLYQESGVITFFEEHYIGDPDLNFDLKEFGVNLNLRLYSMIISMAPVTLDQFSDIFVGRAVSCKVLVMAILEPEVVHCVDTYTWQHSGH